MDKEVHGIALEAKGEEDPTDLYWFFYPHLQENMGKVQWSKEGAKHIRTLDDIFFYNCYGGEIYLTVPYSEKRADPTIPISSRQRVTSDGEVLLSQDDVRDSVSSEPASDLYSLDYTDIYLRELEHQTWIYFAGGQ